MQFSILSIALAVLAAAPHALAAPATPNEAAPAAVSPVEAKLDSALVEHDPAQNLTERDLQTRQQYNAKGWAWGNGKADCFGKDATFNSDTDYVVGLSYRQNGDGSNCRREVHIVNQGVDVTAKVVGRCQQCGDNDLGLSRAVMKRFTQGYPEKIDIQWCKWT
ncbi:unnamed protein product [Rhizoctonia solani]|uniref:RlpA-like protein double-psi beta-barrel domain-containing protein n=1 Tax=Rhizoctonia solani TaxID=456999 RepID=A0A8H3CPD6_9AGAM|nr:unnamed protein product [Rhizoctonia solani]CAE6530985.1 unnamed protein product [Rhizoctonia solani]